MMFCGEWPTQTPIPAVVVFSSRTPDCYDEAHRRFLDNIAQLVTHSFGRTVRLAEHGRLASIGEFASGIAHELRTPLTTIGMALDYFDRQSMPDNAGKRLALAQRESARMRRLLEEILAYAKPLDLRLRPLRAGEALLAFLDSRRDLATSRDQRIKMEGGPTDAWMMADPDRLTQIFANLTQNACDAAPDGAEIAWSVQDQPSSGIVSLAVTNPGPPIPPELLARVTEPFVSTKSTGTGLGLAIVRRLTHAQGGELTITSNAADGTRVRLSFPRMDALAHPQNEAAGN
jgi:signal transduction histidine kinase